MKEAKCYTCDRITANLLTANCSHKICFNCVKNNRNTYRCSVCAISKNKHHAYSPARKQLFDKQYQRSTKTKSIQSHRYKQGSPFGLKSSRKSQLHIQSCSNPIHQGSLMNEEDKNIGVNLLCKKHQQPLTMFSKTAKEPICSICLCSNPKFRDEIMPIKGAQDFLRRQNQLQRQESRTILNSVQSCLRTIKTNNQQFHNFHTTHTRLLTQIFTTLHQQLQKKQSQLRILMDNFFNCKIKECQEIQQDLRYLTETLKSYRQENKFQTNNLNELVYVFSSFKIIKQTIKQLNFDYISYEKGKSVNLLEWNKPEWDRILGKMIRFRQELPIKQDEAHTHKRRSQSNKAFNKSKNQEINQLIFQEIKTPYKGSASKNRQQMSLCSNGSGIQMTEQQKSLYKRLLKSRFLKS